MTLLKQLRKLVHMAKNSPKKGKSVRNGNAPSPYNKKNKTPYLYSSKYYEWRRDRLAGRAVPQNAPIRKYKNDLNEFEMAAE